MVMTMLKSLLIALFLIITNIALADVNAEVDRTSVSEGESITLTLSSNSSNDSPDLSILDANFDRLGTSQSHSTSIINGNVSSESTWIIQLMPKQVGSIIIPPITIGNEKTTPITIEVTKQSASPNNTPKAITGSATQPNANMFFEATVDKKEAFVQSQIIYTQRFYYRPDLPISDISIDELSIEGASVETLNTKGPKYQKEINGAVYQIIEGTYAIFPEKSGELHIPSRTLTVQMQASMFEPPRIAKLRSDELTMTVLPQPNKTTPWLPAKSVTLQENWSTSPPVFKVGESVTRKITMIADGLSQSHLPPLAETTIDGLKMYADKPETRNTVSTQGIIGTRTDSVAIVATKPGTFTLPAINIKWWDTKENAEKTATIEAFTFTVEDNPTTASSTLAPPPATVSQNKPALQENTPQADNSSQLSHNVWIYVAALLFVLWAVTLWMWWKSRQTVAVIRSAESTTQSDLQSSTRLLNKLTQACNSNDAKQAKEALLNWARAHWSANNSMTLNEIILRAPSLAIEINKLEQSLYSSSASTWQGKLLLDAVNHLPKEASTKKANQPTLNPLYPSP